MEIFFNKLSERLYNENNLSDLTWALCYENKTFRNLFISYCFSNENISNIREFEREFRKCKSRPDFHFYDADEIEYLIEIKNYDQKMHFKQYIKDFPNARKCFIANYYWKEEPGYIIKTWKGFIIKLEDNIKKIKELNCELFLGYLKYLKNITYYYEEKTMNLSNISSLYTFQGMMVECCENKQLKPYRRGKPCNLEYYGLYYKCKKNNKSYNFWIGICFKETLDIIFEIHNFPRKDYTKLEKLHDGTFFTVKEDGWAMHLKKQHFKKLCNDRMQPDTQKKILENFLNEILKNLGL
jgi:hypothetical protein